MWSRNRRWRPLHLPLAPALRTQAVIGATLAFAWHPLIAIINAMTPTNKPLLVVRFERTPTDTRNGSHIPRLIFQISY